MGKEREIALQGEKDKEREAGIVGLLPNSGGKESERESFNQAKEKKCFIKKKERLAERGGREGWSD